MFAFLSLSYSQNNFPYFLGDLNTKKVVYLINDKEGNHNLNKIIELIFERRLCD